MYNAAAPPRAAAAAWGVNDVCADLGACATCGAASVPSMLRTTCLTGRGINERLADEIVLAALWLGCECSLQDKSHQSCMRPAAPLTGGQGRPVQAVCPQAATT